MSRIIKRISVVFLAFTLVASVHAEVQVVVKSRNATCRYKAGEKGEWTVAVSGADLKKGKSFIDWNLRLVNGPVVSSVEDIPFTGKPVVIKAGPEKPCGTLLKVTWRQAEDSASKEVGAFFGEEAVTPSAPEPADFTQFWNAKKAELDRVPMSVVLEPVDDPGNPDIELFKITMSNIRGSRIRGYFSIPRGEGPFPAMLICQWAGVYGLNKWWSIGNTKAGWMTLNILAHDIEVDREQAYYDGLNAGALKDYPQLGKDDREKSYFLKMYLATVRAVQFLTSRPEWNKQTLVVKGGSQGGGLSLVAAGLNPEITLVSAMVPAMCDHTACLAAQCSDGGAPLFLSPVEADRHPIDNFARSL